MCGVKYSPFARDDDDDGVVQVTDITLNGVSISSDTAVFQSGKGTIITSGTTDTYLPRATANGFSEAWEAATGSVSCPLLHLKLVCLGSCDFIAPPRPARLFRGLGRIGAKASC